MDARYYNGSPEDPFNGPRFTPEPPTPMCDRCRVQPARVFSQDKSLCEICYRARPVEKASAA